MFLLQNFIHAYEDFLLNPLSNCPSPFPVPFQMLSGYVSSNIMCLFCYLSPLSTAFNCPCLYDISYTTGSLSGNKSLNKMNYVLLLQSAICCQQCLSQGQGFMSPFLIHDGDFVCYKCSSYPFNHSLCRFMCVWSSPDGLANTVQYKYSLPLALTTLLTLLPKLDILAYCLLNSYHYTHRLVNLSILSRKASVQQVVISAEIHN